MGDSLRARTKMFAKQASQVTTGYSQPLGQAFYVATVQSAVSN
jgi:hypothetical protein